MDFLRHPGVPSLPRCVSGQNGPLPNPFHSLCPCAQRAAGAVYTDCLTTQCTWRTATRWRFEVASSDSSPGRKLNNKQQVSCSTCGRIVRAFGGPLLTDGASDYRGDPTVFVCSVCLLVLIQPAYTADSFVYMTKRATQGGPSQTHQPLQEFLWAGVPGWMWPLGGLTDSVRVNMWPIGTYGGCIKINNLSCIDLQKQHQCSVSVQNAIHVVSNMSDSQLIWLYGSCQATSLLLW